MERSAIRGSRKRMGLSRISLRSIRATDFYTPAIITYLISTYSSMP
jgi:hypothetical protein